MDIRFIGLDPSTKTGFVILDKQGNVIDEKEITGDGSTDPKRMVTLTDKVMSELREGDVICLEGFSYGSRGRGIGFQFGLGHSIRNGMYKLGIPYILVAPGQLKKFATGKGNTAKENMILPIYKRWDYEGDTDNIRDAFVLAQIARAMKGYGKLVKYQEEVVKELAK